MQGLTSYSINDNGDLVFKLTDEGQDFIQEAINDGTNIQSDDFFMELVEGPLCNGLQEIRPEETGDLTSSLIFSDDCERNDLGELVACNKRYWFPDYAIRSPADDLNKKGECIFTAAK
jgi:hypothetical protein